MTDSEHEHGLERANSSRSSASRSSSSGAGTNSDGDGQEQLNALSGQPCDHSLPCIWDMTTEQMEYYTEQFLSLQPDVNGLVSTPSPSVTIHQCRAKGNTHSL